LKGSIRMAKKVPMASNGENSHLFDYFCKGFMKRIFSIVLISFYIVSFTEVHQLIRLPLLAVHFIEHKALSKDITFFEFLELHYSTETAHDDRDMELPFKDCSHCVASQTVVLPCFKIELKQDAMAYASPVYTVFYKKFIPSSHLSEIWQPPKV